MPYRLDIPGQVSEFQLRAIEAVASLVPENGCMVEVGSLFGLSSWAWAKSVPQSASVYCIDPWEGNQGVSRMEKQYGIRYGIEQFKAHVADCPNIIPLQAYSPDGVQDWSTPIDLYYEDAVHHNPILARNIEFWTSKLKPTGILCGDDYRPRFADVRNAAGGFAEATGRRLWIVDFFWCVLPDPALVPAAAAVADILAGLADEVAEDRKGSKALIRVGPVLAIPAELPSATPITTRVRVVNDGMQPWPAEPDGNIEVATQILTADDQVIGETIWDLPVEQLRFDEPIEALVALPLGDTLPGGARLRIGLTRPAGDGQIDHFEQRIAFAPSKDSSTPAEPPKAPRTFHLGEIIALNSVTASPPSGTGWSRPERRYTWCEGEQSELALAIAENLISARWLNLRLQPFVVAGGVAEQRLTIGVNDVEIFHGQLSGPTALSLPLPNGLSGPVRIRFEHPDAHRPRDSIEGSTDRRQLAFAVEAIAISAKPLSLR